MDNACTSNEFTGHRDPYTGEPLTVRLFVLSGGKVKYRIEGAYDVSTRYPTFDAALAAWSRVNGVSGLRNPAKEGFVCAYTGVKMKPVVTPGEARFDRGFLPMRFLTRTEVLRILAYISGTEAVKTSGQRVEAVREAPPAPKFHDEHDPSDEALRRAGLALDASRDALERSGVAPAKRTVVTPGRKLRK